MLGWTDSKSYGKYHRFGMLWEDYDGYIKSSAVEKESLQINPRA